MLRFDAKTLLKIIVGVDLVQVPGISEISAMELISEIGIDMNKWASAKHFAAWLNLAPNTKITGGKIITSKMQKKKNHAGQTLRMCANSIGNSKSPLGDFSRKMKSRLGKRGGIVATAHKLSRIVYTMIKEKREYNPEKVVKDLEKQKRNKIKYYEEQILKLKKAC